MIDDGAITEVGIGDMRVGASSRCCIMESGEHITRSYFTYHKLCFIFHCAFAPQESLGKKCTNGSCLESNVGQKKKKKKKRRRKRETKSISNKCINDRKQDTRKRDLHPIPNQPHQSSNPVTKSRV